MSVLYGYDWKEVLDDCGSSMKIVDCGTGLAVQVKADGEDTVVFMKSDTEKSLYEFLKKRQT